MRLRVGVAALVTAVSFIAPSLAAAATIRVPEGTEMVIRLNDNLSSGTSTEGDQFSITLLEPVKLSDGTVLKPGYRGRGEVVKAKKKGFAGQAGELNIRINYLRVGDSRIRLRGNKGDEGKGALGATIALSVFFGPLGLLKHGHDIEIKAGQTLTAYVDTDADIDTPLTEPPQVDWKPGAVWPAQPSSWASRVISAFSTLETGQFCSAPLASSANFAASIPGTRACSVSAERLIRNPPPSAGSSDTAASVFSSSAGNPACCRANARAIEKQPAWAAASSSSGLVPGWSSKRVR